MSLEITVDGVHHEVRAEAATLLDVLRDELGVTSVKDGCSPQGQCGCCTVLIDGSPRVACVTPVRRIAGRTIITMDGLDPDERSAWCDAFVATGASQCGFCTPGIVMRLVGAAAKGVAADDRQGLDNALAAHLCRCTGWQTIEASYVIRVGGDVDAVAAGTVPRDFEAAARRATLEGGAPQRVGPEIVRGRGGFAADTAPRDALVAVPDGVGGWVVSDSLADARARAGKVQGRRTTFEARPPLELPDDGWALSLRTSWVEPAYLETDASWCEPGGEPASPLANGGAFGAKRSSVVGDVARRLADEHGRAVRVVLSREDTVRLGPKRPPMAIGVREDGSALVHVVRTPGVAALIRSAWPGPRIEVVEVDVPGPPTAIELRATGWAELTAMWAAWSTTEGPISVEHPAGGRATVSIGERGTIRVRVMAGDPLDEVVLRSFVIGAVHQALGWVTSEGLAVDQGGDVHDLTIRSFGILRAADMPRVAVEVELSDGPAVAVGDAVLAATAAAVWRGQGSPPVWPTALPWPTV